MELSAGMEAFSVLPTVVLTTSNTRNVAFTSQEMHFKFYFTSFYLKSVSHKGYLKSTGVKGGSDVLFSPGTFLH